MNITSAVFRCSSQKLSQCPADNRWEFAFIGRSNVGKSSLINMLTDSPALAKVSATPGKTRLINHFLINGCWYLVDLPGYGYARVSKGQRKEFSKLILDYILKREQMYFLFVLVDSRLEPQKIDLDFMRRPYQTEHLFLQYLSLFDDDAMVYPCSTKSSLVSAFPIQQPLYCEASTDRYPPNFPVFYSLF